MKKRVLAFTLIGILALASAGFATTFITIGSGVERNLLPLGGAMAEVLTNAGIDVKATSRATSASRENCRLVAADRAQIGMSMASTLYQAITGTEAFEPDGKLPLQILMSMYPAPQHLVTVKGSGITKLEDIRGKKVSVGAPGGGDQILTNLILKAAGIDPEKDFSRHNLPSPRVMAEGRQRGRSLGTAIPGSAVMEVAAQREVVHPPGEELVKKVVEKPFPRSFPSGGDLRGIKEDILTVADGILVVRNDGRKTLLQHHQDPHREQGVYEHHHPGRPLCARRPPYHHRLCCRHQKYFTEQGVDMK